MATPRHVVDNPTNAIAAKLYARRKGRSPIRFPQSPPAFGWFFGLLILAILGYLVYSNLP